MTKLPSTWQEIDRNKVHRLWHRGGKVQQLHQTHWLCNLQENAAGAAAAAVVLRT